MAGKSIKFISADKIITVSVILHTTHRSKLRHVSEVSEFFRWAQTSDVSEFGCKRAHIYSAAVWVIKEIISCRIKPIPGLALLNLQLRAIGI